MAKNLPTTKQNTTPALQKAKHLIAIANEIVAKSKNGLLADSIDYRLHIALEHSRSVNSVVITHDGKYIVSGSNDGTIKLWDIQSGEEMAQFVSFDDGEWIASTKDGYYNCSDEAMKYIGFFDGDKLIEKSHPIYKQRRKKSLGIKIGKIIDRYPNGVPQTDVGEIDTWEIDIWDEIDDEDELPF